MQYDNLEKVYRVKRYFDWEETGEYFFESLIAEKDILCRATDAIKKLQK